MRRLVDSISYRRMSTSTPHTGSDALQPGSRFGRYRVERKLGSGGMGAVYEALHVDLKKRVAIKALHPQVARDPEVRIRFLREGESAARIRHPNVVDIYDVGSEGDFSFLVMEYLEGHDLGAVLRQGRGMSSQEIARVLLPVSAALHAAHERGVVHRDIKPSNIFLAQGMFGETVPKLLDFGISKRLDEQGPDGGLTLTGAVMGTPYYMSPEQAHGDRAVDARSDQYSLGVIAYQCATGQRPFVADSMYQVLHKIVEGDFRPPRELNPSVSRSLERLILKSMANRPQDRFPSLIEFGRTLLDVADERTFALWEPLFGNRTIGPESAGPSGATAATDVDSFFFRETSPLGDQLELESGLPVLAESQTGASTGTLEVPRSRLPLLALIAVLLLGGAAAIGIYLGRGATPAPVKLAEESERRPAAMPPPLEAAPNRERPAELAQPNTMARPASTDGRSHPVSAKAPMVVKVPVSGQARAPEKATAVRPQKARSERRRKDRARRNPRRPPATKRPVAKPAPPSLEPEREPQPKTGTNDALIIR